MARVSSANIRGERESHRPISEIAPGSTPPCQNFSEEPCQICPTSEGDPGAPRTLCCFPTRAKTLSFPCLNFPRVSISIALGLCTNSTRNTLPRQQIFPTLQVSAYSYNKHGSVPSPVSRALTTILVLTSPNPLRDGRSRWPPNSIDNSTEEAGASSGLSPLMCFHHRSPDISAL